MSWMFLFIGILCIVACYNNMPNNGNNNSNNDGNKSSAILITSSELLQSSQGANNSSNLLSSQSQNLIVKNNKTGIHNGYFYSFWSEDTGHVSMTLKENGSYSVSWQNCKNFTAGKGWVKGGAKEVHFSGSFNAGSNGYLAVYGWTQSPLVEYYIIENHGSWEPPGGTPLGEVTSDNGTYKIYKTTRINQPSIIGTATFYQYWSVRTETRSSGVVTTTNHFDAWNKLGLQLGSFDYMILLTEGYQSSGNSDLTVY